MDTGSPLSKTAEEWLRRMQRFAFRLRHAHAWATEQSPVVSEVANEVKDVMTLRMQLLPYLYNSLRNIILKASRHQQ